jgi:hypothetical protein
MRKLLVIAVAVALASLAAADLRAEEGSELEISGNVTTLAGWQRPSKNPNLGADGILNDAWPPRRSDDGHVRILH